MPSTTRVIDNSTFSGINALRTDDSIRSGSLIICSGLAAHSICSIVEALIISPSAFRNNPRAIAIFLSRSVNFFASRSERFSVARSLSRLSGDIALDGRSLRRLASIGNLRWVITSTTAAVLTLNISNVIWSAKHDHKESIDRGEVFVRPLNQNMLIGRNSNMNVTVLRYCGKTHAERLLYSSLDVSRHREVIPIPIVNIKANLKGSFQSMVRMASKNGTRSVYYDYYSFTSRSFGQYFRGNSAVLLECDVDQDIRNALKLADDIAIGLRPSNGSPAAVKVVCTSLSSDLFSDGSSDSTALSISSNSDEVIRSHFDGLIINGNKYLLSEVLKAIDSFTNNTHHERIKLNNKSNVSAATSPSIKDHAKAIVAHDSNSTASVAIAIDAHRNESEVSQRITKDVEVAFAEEGESGAPSIAANEAINGLLVLIERVGESARALPQVFRWMCSLAAPTAIAVKDGVVRLTNDFVDAMSMVSLSLSQSLTPTYAMRRPSAPILFVDTDGLSSPTTTKKKRNHDHDVDLVLLQGIAKSGFDLRPISSTSSHEEVGDASDPQDSGNRTVLIIRRSKYADIHLDSVIGRYRRRGFSVCFVVTGEHEEIIASNSRAMSDRSDVKVVCAREVFDGIFRSVRSQVADGKSLEDIAQQMNQQAN